MLTLLVLGTAPIKALNGDTNNPDKTIDITKTLTKKANTPIPNTPFTFSVTIPTEKDIADSQSSKPNQTIPNIAGVPVYPGKPDVFETSYTISAPADLDSSTTLAASQIDPTNATTGTYPKLYQPVTLDPTAKVTNPTATFGKPGLYRYVIQETSTGFPGITVTSPAANKYYLDVYVINDGNSGQLKIADIIAWNASMQSSSTGALVDFKTDEFNFINNYSTSELKISKVVAGNAADLNKEFQFSLSITPDNAKDEFVLIAPDNTSSSTKTQTLKATAAGNPITTTVSLKNGQQFVVYGLTAKDAYSVKETDLEVTDGAYTGGISPKTNDTKGTVIDSRTPGGNTSVDPTDPTKTIYNVSVEGEQGDTDKYWEFTNTREVTGIPTNYISTYGPYIAGLAVLGGLGFVMLRKKKASE